MSWDEVTCDWLLSTISHAIAIGVSGAMFLVSKVQNELLLLKHDTEVLNVNVTKVGADFSVQVCSTPFGWKCQRVSFLWGRRLLKQSNLRKQYLFYHKKKKGLYVFLADRDSEEGPNSLLVNVSVFAFFLWQLTMWRNTKITKTQQEDSSAFANLSWATSFESHQNKQISQIICFLRFGWEMKFNVYLKRWCRIHHPHFHAPFLLLHRHNWLPFKPRLIKKYAAQNLTCSGIVVAGPTSRKVNVQ